MPIVSFKLLDLINEIGIDNTNVLLSGFSCSKDADVEYFLREKAIPFECSDKSRTTLICWVSDDRSKIEIIAYYSLASNIFHLDGLSRSLQKRIRSGELQRNNKSNAVTSILIGQLGRNDNAKTLFTSNALFLEVFKSINEINLLIGTRIIYLECRDVEKLIELYKSRGFRLLTDNKGKPIINNSNNENLITFIMSMKNMKQILKDNKIV